MTSRLCANNTNKKKNNNNNISNNNHHNHTDFTCHEFLLISDTIAPGPARLTAQQTSCL